jgi:hypothetical protein
VSAVPGVVEFSKPPAAVLVVPPPAASRMVAEPPMLVLLAVGGVAPPDPAAVREIPAAGFPYRSAEAIRASLSRTCRGDSAGVAVATVSTV